MAEAMRRALCDDAMTMLVLWATRQEYDAGVETLLAEWSGILGISQEAMALKVDAAMGATLQRPVLRRYASLAAHQPAGIPQPRAAGAGGDKRAYPGGGGSGGEAKKLKVAGSASPELAIFEGVSRAEAMVGRKVKRYWPEDASKNKGDPWFVAVVTDYDPATRVHVLTYSLGTQKEEKEDVDVSKLPAGSIDLTPEWVDLERWLADPKKRDRSYAVRTSKYLRARAVGVAP